MSMEEMTALQEQLDRIEAATSLAAKRALNLEEVTRFTGFEKRTIYELTSRKEIPHYKKNGRLFFNKEEIEGWLLQNRVQTNEELRQRASTYMALKRV